MNGLAYLAPSSTAARLGLGARRGAALLERQGYQRFGRCAGKKSAAAADIGGAVLAAPIVDTVKRETAGRARDRGACRPVARADSAGICLRSAAQGAARCGWQGAGSHRRGAGHGTSRRSSRCWCRGSPFNIKVTRAEDLELAAAILKMGESSQMRIGQGVDVHAFGAGDHVVLGGVRIAHCTGHRCALGRRCGHSRAVRRLAWRHGRWRHRPAFSRQRPALSRRRQPGVPARRCDAHEVGRITLGQCGYHGARRGAAHRRSSQRHGCESGAGFGSCGLRQSTSRRPPRSAWDSSAARKVSPRWPQCCCPAEIRS